MDGVWSLVEKGVHRGASLKPRLFSCHIPLALGSIGWELVVIRSSKNGKWIAAFGLHMGICRERVKAGVGMLCILGSFAVAPREPMGLAGGHQRAFNYCWVSSLLIQKWLTKTWREFLIRKSLQKSPHRNNKLFNSVRGVKGKILQSS